MESKNWMVQEALKARMEISPTKHGWWTQSMHAWQGEAKGHGQGSHGLKPLDYKRASQSWLAMYSRIHEGIKEAKESSICKGA